ncbi:neurensin-1-like [Daktulosphaira vitifoliae]|uniref:neurensin-1-like n=1 Tax=Daktulosphaira vitifoliae TaxID=58002 RepID=UPI0021A9F6CE|nr:neurensin-1-like [Daktulosphaira vitifoliae]XP_050543765.1 neurensin-1-like [Daktulosphaira vitifoliae]
MTADNDGESLVSSSSGNVDYNPVMPRKQSIAKGILVHNTRKSSAGNRVSFASSHPSSRSSSISSSRSDRSKIDHQQIINESYVQPSNKSSCFGIKSHLHEFYDTPDYSSREDNFRYLIEPKSRFAQHCCNAWAFFGLTVISIGALTLAAGHLIPAKDPIVDRTANMEVVDRYAINYNQNLVTCRYVGAIVFSIGVVFSVIRLWVSLIRNISEDDRFEEEKMGKDELGKQFKSRPQTSRIPISGSVECVQPNVNSIG